MSKKINKDDKWEYEFVIPCNHCRKNAILEMRKLGLKFRIRGQRILGNLDVYKYCEKNFAQFESIVT
jgi:hypothetical protein